MYPTPTFVQELLLRLYQLASTSCDSLIFARPLYSGDVGDTGDLIPAP